MPNETKMMKCGHAANATDDKGDPCCVICIGIDPGAAVVADTPDFTDRKAKCTDSCIIADSSTDLAFFEHLPDEDYDRYYCGCRGWD